MIKKLWRSLFSTDKKQTAVTNVFNVKEETQKLKDSSPSLEKVHIETVVVPDFGDQEGMTLTKWHFKTGDIVKEGAVVCEIENKKMTLEFECFFNGRIISTCPLHQKLTTGMELLKIEVV